MCIIVCNFSGFSRIGSEVSIDLKRLVMFCRHAPALVQAEFALMKKQETFYQIIVSYTEPSKMGGGGVHVLDTN